MNIYDIVVKEDKTWLENKPNQKKKKKKKIIKKQGLVI